MYKVSHILCLLNVIISVYKDQLFRSLNHNNFPINDRLCLRYGIMLTIWYYAYDMVLCLRYGHLGLTMQDWQKDIRLSHDFDDLLID
jgi:hypothetical protein